MIGAEKGGRHFTSTVRVCDFFLKLSLFKGQLVLCSSQRKHGSLVFRPREDAFTSGGEINWGSKGNNYRGKLK